MLYVGILAHEKDKGKWGQRMGEGGELALVVGDENAGRIRHETRPPPGERGAAGGLRPSARARGGINRECVPQPGQPLPNQCSHRVGTVQFQCGLGYLASLV